jgi:hypothetical protein
MRFSPNSTKARSMPAPSRISMPVNRCATCRGSFDYTQLIDRGSGPEHANTFCARQRLVQQLKLLAPISGVRE